MHQSATMAKLWEYDMEDRCCRCFSQILENTEDLCTYIFMYAIMITANRRSAQVEVMTMTFTKKKKEK